jgi:hypothetical protein
MNLHKVSKPLRRFCLLLLLEAKAGRCKAESRAKLSI